MLSNLTYQNQDVEGKMLKYFLYLALVPKIHV